MDNFLHEYNLAQQAQEEIKTKTKNLNKLVEGDRMNCSTYMEKDRNVSYSFGKKKSQMYLSLPHENGDFSWIYKR